MWEHCSSGDGIRIPLNLSVVHYLPGAFPTCITRPRNNSVREIALPFTAKQKNLSFQSLFEGNASRDQMIRRQWCFGTWGFLKFGGSELQVRSYSWAKESRQRDESSDGILRTTTRRWNKKRQSLSFDSARSCQNIKEEGHSQKSFKPSWISFISQQSCQTELWVNTANAFTCRNTRSSRTRFPFCEVRRRSQASFVPSCANWRTIWATKRLVLWLPSLFNSLFLSPTNQVE